VADLVAAAVVAAAAVAVVTAIAVGKICGCQQASMHNGRFVWQ